jgi:NAD(P)-dependent dehydrogenase (short-subunit alcohol dehydrogenase family)
MGEERRQGQRANALAPGYVATDMTLKMRERPELFNVWLDMTPMGSARRDIRGRCGCPLSRLGGVGISDRHHPLDRRRLHRVVIFDRVSALDSKAPCFSASPIGGSRRIFPPSL